MAFGSVRERPRPQAQRIAPFAHIVSATSIEWSSRQPSARVFPARLVEMGIGSPV
jgi:hypothetical protein